MAKRDLGETEEEEEEELGRECLGADEGCCSVHVCMEGTKI